MTPNPPSVLVVDDDTDTCRNLRDILTDLGYEVDTAHDGPTGLERIQNKSYDVALLDMKMPGMNGLELYRKMRQYRASTVAIIVTAYASAETEEQALAAGAWKVLPKPVDLRLLLSLVGEIVEQPLVLVIDDDPDLCHSLWDLLRDRRFRVSMAHDPSTAEAQLREKAFSVVLIDMKLPQAGGAEVFRMVRLANPQARTILISGYRGEMENMMKAILNDGADALCYKPFDVPALLSTLEGLVKRSDLKAGNPHVS